MNLTTLRERARRARAALDLRDLVLLAGLALLGYGLESIHPGAGYAAAGAVLILIATLLR